MTGSGVDSSRALIQGDVIRQNKHGFTVDERMPGLETLHLFSGKCHQDRAFFKFQEIGAQAAAFGRDKNFSFASNAAYSNSG